ncbi:MAG: Gx transporter family protein [Clostridium sp.]
MNKSKKMVYLALLLAMAIALHIFESMIAIPLPYGAKLGLANIIALITMELFSAREMVAVNFLRVLLGSLIRGTLFSSTFWISGSGVLFSSISIILVKKFTKQSMIGLSIISSVFHNIGQVAASIILYSNTSLGAILPILLILSIPTGIFVGIAANECVLKLKKLGVGI